MGQTLSGSRWLEKYVEERDGEDAVTFLHGRPRHGDTSMTAATTEFMGRRVPVWWPGDCDSNSLLYSVEGATDREFVVGQVSIFIYFSFFFERVSFAQASDSLGSLKTALNS